VDDVLIAHTDGVSEAADPDGKQLDIEGVRKPIEQVCSDNKSCEHGPRRMLDRVLALPPISGRR
jgi:serine phosphatase RsbU (regulator of sigma subunit)